MNVASDNEDDYAQYPGLAEKVRFLSSPRHYPEQPERVEVVETHMSFVFLTPSAVYKLKKPVHNAYFDFRTLDSRRENCQAEVRLNRRLAPRTYLGVVRLKQADSANLQLGGTGRVVDWLVHMRRLPTEKMLDQLIKSDRLTFERIDQLGQLLVAFYQRAKRIGITPNDYRLRYQTYVDRWMSNLRNPLYGLAEHRLDHLEQRLQRFVTQGDRNGLADRSVRVVEAHGDLKPEHICFTEPPEIIDCLEFSRELRSLDPIEELCYLAIECERLGAGYVGDRLIQVYGQRTEDRAPSNMVVFYKAYRSVLRAHLSARHLLDEQVKDPEHWLNRTHEYLDMATHYLDGLDG